MPDLIDILNPAIESYNGFTFSPNTQTRLRCRPVLDRSGRATMYHEFTFDVNTFVLAPLIDDAIGDTEAQMLAIYKKLNMRGGRLRATGLGIGNFLINDAGPVIPDGVVLYRDVANGPHPRNILFTPMGSNKAWGMQWQCVTNLIQCNEGTAVDFGADRIMAFNYTWAVSRNEHGFSTRVISGDVVIPSTIMPGKRLPPYVADSLWERTINGIPVPPGFLRQSEHRLSEDRRTISFTITDTEKSVEAFVPGATTWEADQETGTTLQDGFTRWTNTLTATYQVSRDRAKAELYLQFLALAKSRTDMALRPLGEEKKKGWYPLELRVRDSITSQAVTFTYRWLLISEWKYAIRSSGMWEAVPEATWAKWADSMGQTSLHPRGNARLAYDAASDSIIDLCEDPKLNIKDFGLLTGRIGGVQGQSDALPLAAPIPDESWVAYEAAIYYETDQGTTTLQPLPIGPFAFSGMPPEASGYLRSGNEASGNDGFVTFDTSPTRLPSRVPAMDVPKGVSVNVTIPIPESPGVKNIVQQRVQPTAMARFVGRALRVGYPINPPELVIAAGSVAILEHERFGTSFVANYGLPLVYAEWDLLYSLPNFKRGSLSIPGNPVLGL